VTKPRVPANLSPNGRRFWREMVGKYEFRPDELRILEDACREADLIDSLEVGMRACLASNDMMVKGSMGQLVINPMISELRQHRATLAGLLRGLKLPDEAGGELGSAAGSGERSSAARHAALVRWRGPYA
jgi:hypothetical protein